MNIIFYSCACRKQSFRDFSPNLKTGLIIHIPFLSSDPALLLVLQTLEFTARSTQRYFVLIREDRRSEGAERDPAQ